MKVSNLLVKCVTSHFPDFSSISPKQTAYLLCDLPNVCDQGLFSDGADIRVELRVRVSRTNMEPTAFISVLCCRNLKKNKKRK